ncbi:MAG: lysylphosphatidylglycerol synthase transmembrane domain-containing protein [Cyanobacteria bacterium J06649_4]
MKSINETDAERTQPDDGERHVMTSKAESPSYPDKPDKPKRLDWKPILGSVLGVAVLVWLISDQKSAEMWAQLKEASPGLLLIGLPVILVNMSVRAIRWRTLLGNKGLTLSFGRVFSALMIGYLANTVLPARAGDLVRVYDLADDKALPLSWVLSTVFVERVLDMAAIILVLAVSALTAPLPDWLWNGALMLAIATAMGIGVLVVLGIAGERLITAALRPFEKKAPKLAGIAKQSIVEFSRGLRQLRSIRVLTSFFVATAALWVLEIGLVLVVAGAFSLPLSELDAAILMLCSLFSSLIPALPGQIGTFELAMVTGLDFLGYSGPTALPFAFMLHLLLLGGTAMIGIACLVYRGLPLQLSSLTAGAPAQPK